MPISMTELFTAAQMRAVETAAISSGEVTGVELMERAGCGVVEAIFEEWPELAKSPHRTVVLCGPGNNGGDGFVVARLLKELGWEVEVFLYGDPDKLPLDAKVNYKRWLALGVVDGPLPNDESLDGEPLVVDALFGTGLSRAPIGEFKSAIDRVSRCCAPEQVVSVDIRSGICADSGRDLSEVLVGKLPVGLTVTFHGAKLGHYLSDGAVTSENLRIVDIGVRARDAGFSYRDCVHLATSAETVAKEPEEHKYDHGHALIFSGGPGKSGAARLAARGALRIGAGLVTVGCPPGALSENAARLDAIMVTPVSDADDLAEILKDERKNALCLGPGLGAERARDLVPTALAVPAPAPGPLKDDAKGGPGSGPGLRSLVMDADALTAFADDPTGLFDLLHEKCILTPHAGEFARLFPDIAEKLSAPASKGPAYSKVDATREAAVRAGCVVLFKGPDTIIAAPDGRCSINSAQYDRSAPWLATAGSGDVLAGFITGLLARGFPPMQAAESAAWLHVECALKFGPGLIAEDLPEILPSVFRDLKI